MAAHVEVPHLAERQTELTARRGERSKRTVVPTEHGEGADHRATGVQVAGLGDLDVGRGRDPPRQEVCPELPGVRNVRFWGWSVQAMLSAYSLVMASKSLRLKAS